MIDKFRVNTILKSHHKKPNNKSKVVKNVPAVFIHLLKLDWFFSSFLVHRRFAKTTGIFVLKKNTDICMQQNIFLRSSFEKELDVKKQMNYIAGLLRRKKNTWVMNWAKNQKGYWSLLQFCTAQKLGKNWRIKYFIGLDFEPNCGQFVRQFSTLFQAGCQQTSSPNRWLQSTSGK